MTAHIASLKWTRPAYAKQLGKEMKGVHYGRSPAEDFASLLVEFETADGHTVVGEATTSWSFVGAGLRLSAELLGTGVLHVVEYARRRPQAVLFTGG